MSKITVLGLVAVLSVVAGCSKNAKPAANSTSSTLTDIAPPPAPTHAMAGPAMPMTPITIAYEPSAAPITPVSSGRSYVVQKGDTLWSLAQRNYGDGKQYKRIVAANPSIQGDRLLTGQTIIIP